MDAAADRPIPIRARTGDRLALKVTSRESATVELEGIGPTEDVGPRQPAFFDVLLREDGDYPVRFLDSQREIATIEVSPPRVPPVSR